VTCDVTLASKPLQVEANACDESQPISGQNRRRALRVCNLRLLLLILAIVARRTVTAAFWPISRLTVCRSMVIRCVF
jgi:hypothetical protein